ncbi:TetR/AcrR family transcriptional regulator [Saccharothrix sp. 6-C]|uniref:TetR/AcrR family transcriptional regulator n=1 Tax=Saccharothrix sp. 6-C TaxID=2781735 RepID=UPI0019178E3B|nr:TetR family transcriptional regulator [Saccharothrix sp. 6-C]QQQ78785.1 TetR/AcrR family transcriptional regulator [Saccharothrix sp. 6-C]
MSRPLRADAQRNRDRLIETALAAFTDEGADATLDAIAKRAGVGIGTLYRHFPTREALVEAVYRNELAKLCDAVPDLLRTLPPHEATRAWMDRFVEYMATKQGMGDALRAVIASGGDPYAQSRDRLTEAMGTLLEAVDRPDVAPLDVIATIAGIAHTVPDVGPADGMLDLVMDGLRYRP